MFQKTKYSYTITAVCSNSDNTAEYTFVVSHDDDWGDIAEEKFRDEFGTNPTEIRLQSRDKIEY